MIHITLKGKKISADAILHDMCFKDSWWLMQKNRVMHSLLCISKRFQQSEEMSEESVSIQKWLEKCLNLMVLHEGILEENDCRRWSAKEIKVIAGEKITDCVLDHFLVGMIDHVLEIYVTEFLP